MRIGAGDAGAAQFVAERLDAGDDLSSADGVLDPVEVEASGGEFVEVDGEVDRHQRVDEQVAVAGAPSEADVAERAAGGGGDLALDDARPVGGGGVCVGDGVAVQRGLPAGAGDGQGAEVAAVAVEGGEVFQHLDMVDAVVGVDAEAETGHQLHRYVQAGDGGHAGDVLHRGTQVAFVAAQQNVGTAVGQHHRVDVEVFDQVPVRRP